jgi:hypothetical protein
MVGAAACAVGACLPRDWLHPLGPMIGRPNAITPDVSLRMRLVAGIFAAVCFLLGLLVVFRPKLLTALRRAWRLERRLWRPPALPDRGWIVAATALGAMARGIHLPTPMAYDESYTFLNYARKSFLEAIADYDSTNNHLLNTCILHWLYQLGGSEEWVLRLGVFAAGVLLIPCSYCWALTWSDRPTAILTMILTATAPSLITYSFDARGYGYVTLSAVVLDWSLRRLHDGTDWPMTWTAISLLAAVLGLWAMPIMAYAILGSGGFFVARRLGTRAAPRKRVLASCTIWLVVVGVLVFALYAPAFIYRGMMFLRDPIMRPVARESQLAAALTSWRAAWDWWTTGILPSAFWAASLGVAAGACLVSGRIPWGWLSPFAAVHLVNLFKSSAPPPRIYLFLTPWIALAAAYGVQAALRAIRCPPRVGLGAAGIVLLAGVSYACRSPVLIYPEERRLFLDVPAVVAAVIEDVSQSGGAPARLLSPLPVDYPTRFYLERERSSIPMNGQPQPGEWIYVIGLPGLSVTDVLKRPPIQLDDEVLVRAVWTTCPVPDARPHPGNLSLKRTRYPDVQEKQGAAEE